MPPITAKSIKSPCSTANFQFKPKPSETVPHTRKASTKKICVSNDAGVPPRQLREPRLRTKEAIRIAAPRYKIAAKTKWRAGLEPSSCAMANMLMVTPPNG